VRFVEEPSPPPQPILPFYRKKEGFPLQLKKEREEVWFVREREKDPDPPGFPEEGEGPEP